jgi:hypothetical protein
VVTINEDNSLEVTPYGTMEVDMIDPPARFYENRYDPAVPTQDGLRLQRVFYLNYRYRTLNEDGTFAEWREVRERLTRIEEE